MCEACPEASAHARPATRLVALRCCDSRGEWRSAGTCPPPGAPVPSRCRDAHALGPSGPLFPRLAEPLPWKVTCWPSHARPRSLQASGLGTTAFHVQVAQQASESGIGASLSSHRVFGLMISSLMASPKVPPIPAPPPLTRTILPSFQGGSSGPHQVPEGHYYVLERCSECSFSSHS